MNYFFKGLLLLTPVTITVWALVAIFDFVDGLLKELIFQVTGREMPGLGFVAVILIVFMVGLLGSSLLFNPIITYFDKIMARAPLIKIIYTSVKDLVSAFVGQKKRFTEPVLVQVSASSHLQKIGFITNKDLKLLGLPNEKVAVYLPHSYAWSGNLFIVSVDYIQPIKASPTEVMKFIISAGVSNLDGHNHDL
jgi:uncharacterized membrane protein